MDLLAPRPDGPDTLQSRAMGPIQLFPPPVRAGPLKDPDPGGELETNGTGVYVYYSCNTTRDGPGHSISKWQVAPAPWPLSSFLA